MLQRKIIKLVEKLQLKSEQLIDCIAKYNELEKELSTKKKLHYGKIFSISIRIIFERDYFYCLNFYLPKIHLKS